jgi:hypothetical protein
LARFRSSGPIENFALWFLRVDIAKAQLPANIRRLSLFRAQNFRLIPSRTVPLSQNSNIFATKKNRPFVAENGSGYIGNKNSKKFHRQDC